MGFHVRRAVAVTAAAASVIAMAGCTAGGSSGGNESKSLTVTYEKSDSFTVMDTLMKRTKAEFEKQHKGVTVKLQPVTASDTDYDTKLSLALRSPSTAPDIFYEDTFILKGHIEAGYLHNLQSYVDKWSDWKLYDKAAQKAGAGKDGGVYAIPLGADTRVIWYSKPVLEKAGITVPWQPKNWNDILDAAAKIKKTEPGVVPFTMYAGTGTGEGTVMQSFYELLYGTGNGEGLYDNASGKWIIGSKGFTDSLKFLQTLYKKKYAVSPSQALDPNVWKTVLGTDFPKNKVGGTVEGSYAPSFWQKGGTFPWADYAKNVGVAEFPTQHGQAPGGVSMSGGWTLAMSAKAQHPGLAFDFMSIALNHKNALWYDTTNAKIAVRSDVASNPTYLNANPFMKAVTKVLSVSHYRPGSSDYPKVSVAAQKATGAVITGQETPQQAAKDYDQAVKQIVGAGNTIQK